MSKKNKKKKDGDRSYEFGSANDVAIEGATIDKSDHSVTSSMAQKKGFLATVGGIAATLVVIGTWLAEHKGWIDFVKDQVVPGEVEGIEPVETGEVIAVEPAIEKPEPELVPVEEVAPLEKTE